MYLKRISISGFKSFVTKVNLSISPGELTGIIGPNGSGKSNIIDAVRWVMGEQSNKSLRGQDPTDLIFNGSAQHSPLSCAEVSLVFDNRQISEFCPPQYQYIPEIEITRTIYRDGSKEITINGKRSRLADLSDFFSSLGLDSKSFAIIQQGQVGEILRSTPQKLYQLIEQTTGIEKYKQKKHLTQLKLQESSTDLQSLKSKLTDLEQQKMLLDQQSKLAQKHHQLTKKAHQIELSIISYDVETAKLSKNSHSQKKQLLQTQLTDLQSTLTELKQQTTSLNLTINQVKTNFDDFQSTDSKLREQIASLQATQQSSQKALLKSQQLHLQTKLSLDQDLKSLEKITSKLTNSQNQLLSASQTHQDLSDKLNKHNKQHQTSFEDLKNLEDQIKDLESQAKKRYRLLIEQKSKLSVLKDKQQTIIKNHLSTHKNLHHQLAEINQLKLSIKALTKKLNDDKNQQKSHLNTSKKLLSSVKEITYKIAKYTDQITKLKIKKAQNQILIDQKHRQVSIQQLDNRTNYQKVIDDLNKSRSISSKDNTLSSTANQTINRKNIAIGFDGISFTDYAKSHLSPQVIHSITAWLHRLVISIDHFDSSSSLCFQPTNSQNIINLLDEFTKLYFDNTQDNDDNHLSYFHASLLAKNYDQDCSSHIEKNISTSSFSEFQLNKLYPKYLQLNSSLKQHRSFHVKLLNSMLYIDDLGDLAKLSISDFFNNVIFFKNSSVIEWGREYRFNLNTHRYNQIQNQIIQLSKQTTNITNNIDILTKQINSLDQQKNSKENKIDDLTKSSTQLNNSIIKHKNDIDHKNTEINRLLTLTIQSKKTISTIKHQQCLIEQQITDTETPLTALKLEDKSTSDLVKKLKLGYSQLSNSSLSAREQLNNHKIDYSNAGLQLKSIKKSISEYQEYLHDISAKTEHKKANLDQQIKDQQHIQAQIADLTQQLTDVTKLKNLNQQHLHRSDKELQLLKAKLEKLSDQKLSLISKKDLINNQINQCSISIAENSSKLNHLTQLLSQKFNLKNPPSFEDDLSTFNRKHYSLLLMEIKNQLNKFGAVNFQAFDQYQQIEKKHLFLSQQLSDLEESIEKLHQGIDDIENICTKKFTKAFNQLNDQFIKIFPMLFDGGEAQLKLITADLTQQNLQGLNHNLTKQKEDKNSNLQTNLSKPDGVQIVVKPPKKRYQSLTLLSGGEQALTAIALIFSFLNANPVPFCLLDEVDAPLDEINVIRYCDIINQYKKKFQFIVITHNRITMETFDDLFGVTMDKDGVSKLISLDLEKNLPSHLKKDNIEQPKALNQ